MRSQKIILFVLILLGNKIIGQQNPYQIFGHTDTNHYYSIAKVNNQHDIHVFSPIDQILTNKKSQRIYRFLSVDPAFKEYTSLTPYNFVNQNPINNIDPDGQRILFVNGYILPVPFANKYLAETPGRPYWAESFLAGVSGFFNDCSPIKDEYFINGSSRFGGDMSGSDRYAAGKKYAEENFKVLTADMVEGETVKIVTHSEGSAYGAGIARYLIDRGIKVETIVHFSSDEGDEFSTPEEPYTMQLGYQGDWITNNHMISSGVDKQGIIFNPSVGPMSAHGATLGDIFKELEDLKSVRVNQVIGPDPQYCPYNTKTPGVSWHTQEPGSTRYNTNFSVINNQVISNPNGTNKTKHPRAYFAD